MSVPTRDDYLLDPDLIFLNHGSYGAVPRVVFEAQQRLLLEMERNPVAFLGRRSDALLAEARDRVARFVGAAADDVVFFPNPTSAINMVATSLRMRPGDEVLTTDHEYGAMDRTWRKRCADAGATVVRVPVPLPVTTEADFVERIWAGVTSRTRVLFLSHLTSATALVFPVHELCRRARAAGIVTIVDGAHVPAHIPLDLSALECDIYTGALHKWLSAPKGCSFLFARREAQSWLEPQVISWGWESLTPSASQFIDHHEWQGTRDLSPFLGVGAAIDFVESHDWSAVRAEGHRLALRTRARIDEITGLDPISPDDGGWIGQLTAIRLPVDVDVLTVQRQLLERFRIEAPVHRWNDQPFVRVSFAAYNTEADSDAMVDAVDALLLALTDRGDLANVGGMGMPTGLGVIDLMMGIPEPGHRDQWYSFLRPNLRDVDSRQMAMPAQYLFKDIPTDPTAADMIEWTVDQMDGHGIERALIGASLDGGIQNDAIQRHPDRFFGCLHVDPNGGMAMVRDIQRAHDILGIRGVSLFPSGCNPPLPINDKRMFPVYAKCAELGLPVLCCVGVPGPRVPMAPQHVELVDEVCWYFPELVFVMRHGGEPWVDLAVKLLLKWPNLYYSTSAFAPKRYPKPIIDFANTRGADKVMYAGYFPMGLSLERIFAELPGVPLRDDVWPKFLRGNAARVFGLPE